MSHPVPSNTPRTEGAHHKRAWCLAAIAFAAGCSAEPLSVDGIHERADDSYAEVAIRTDGQAVELTISRHGAVDVLRFPSGSRAAEVAGALKRRTEGLVRTIRVEAGSNIAEVNLKTDAEPTLVATCGGSAAICSALAGQAKHMVPDLRLSPHLAYVAAAVAATAALVRVFTPRAQKDVYCSNYGLILYGVLGCHWECSDGRSGDASKGTLIAEGLIEDAVGVLVDEDACSYYCTLMCANLL